MRRQIPFAALLLATVATPGIAMPAGGTSEAALAKQAAMLQPNAWVWRDSGSTGALRVVISLADQRAYVYRGRRMIAVSSAATGRDGKETPTGVFPILQKQVKHKSSLYDAAPMPYMERLTWDGVALHGGSTPGYRNSHGCVHLPLAFAKKLYAATRIGTVVEVTDASVVATDPRMLPPDPAIDAEETAKANAAALSAAAGDADQASPPPNDAITPEKSSPPLPAATKSS